MQKKVLSIVMLAMMCMVSIASAQRFSEVDAALGEMIGDTGTKVPGLGVIVFRDGKIYSIPPEYSIKEFFAEDGKFYDDGVHFAAKDEKIGEYFKYCNLNYGVLGTIIERVTGERFDKYQQRHVLKPLGIKADYVVGNLGRKEFGNLGTLYQKNKDDVWDENFDWIAQMDDYASQPSKDMVLVQNPYDRDTNQMYSVKNYRVGTNATIFSPPGGLRISFEEWTKIPQASENSAMATFGKRM